MKVQMNCGWKFFDKIETVEVIETTVKNAQDADLNKQFMLMRSIIIDNDSVKKIYMFKAEQILAQVIVVDVNNVYLLNDNGKTIERIN
jgi:hypothetical protein